MCHAQLAYFVLMEEVLLLQEIALMDNVVLQDFYVLEVHLTQDQEDKSALLDIIVQKVPLQFKAAL